jgi:hypothetical protein
MRIGSLLAAITLASGPAFGCGYCVEDRIAAVYDHGLIAQTLAHGHEVAFIAYETHAPTGDAGSIAIRRALETIDGIDRGSVRLASDSFSFAFDPRRLPPSKLPGAIERRLLPLGVSTTLLRIGNPVSDPKPAPAARVSSR